MKQLTILALSTLLAVPAPALAQAARNLTKSTPKRVLIVVSNPVLNKEFNLKAGFWASELTHAYYEFTEHGVGVTVASPQGGKVEFDAPSDPRDPSGYSAEDLISMGFAHTPKLMALLDNTPSLENITSADYDAIDVAGGEGPMNTFATATRLHELLREFYETEKPTAAICHGTYALLFTKLSSGELLVKGKTMTGFANSEEDLLDQFVGGKRFHADRIEDRARALGANFISAGTYKPFAVRDGRLITGQQQYSGRQTAALVLEALGL